MRLAGCVILIGILGMSARAAERKNNQFVIQGGLDYLTNFQDHEQDALAFYHLLGKSALVLNGADGMIPSPVFQFVDRSAPRTPVIALKGGGDVKGDGGAVSVTPSEWKVPTRGATYLELEQIFEGLRGKGKEAATFVFGGHGDKQGVALWNFDGVDSGELRDWHAGLDADTLVRSIHLHCHGAETLSSRVPVGIAEAPQAATAFEKAYRKNSCGLALSERDELTPSYTKEKKWTEGPWPAVFKATSKEGARPSLRALRDYLAKDDAMVSRVKLTSDNFIEDLFGYLCENGYFRARVNGGRVVYRRVEGEHQLKKSARHEADAGTPCDETGKTAELAELSRKVAAATELFEEADEYKASIAKDVIKDEAKRDARKLRAFQAWESKHKELAALREGHDKWRKAKRRTEKERKDRDQMMHQLLNDVLPLDLRVSAIQNQLSDQRAFEEKWKQEYRDWLPLADSQVEKGDPKPSAEFPRLHVLVRTRPDYGKLHPDALERKLKREMEELQLKRKQLADIFWSSRRKFVEAKLKELVKAKEGDGAFEKLLALYDSLAACEGQPL